MATTTTKLYIEYKTENEKTWTLSVIDPNPGIDWTTVRPVAQLAITNNLVEIDGLYGLTTISDAYVRQITDTAVKPA